MQLRFVNKKFNRVFKFLIKYLVRHHFTAHITQNNWTKGIWMSSHMAVAYFLHRKEDVTLTHRLLNIALRHFEYRGDRYIEINTGRKMMAFRYQSETIYDSEFYYKHENMFIFLREYLPEIYQFIFSYKK